MGYTRPLLLRWWRDDDLDGAEHVRQPRVLGLRREEVAVLAG